MSDELRARYAAVVAALCELADAYYRAGKLTSALRTAESGRALLDTAGDGEVTPAERARMAVQHAFILTHRTFYANERYDEALGAADGAVKLARTAGDERLIADALDLLGLARYNRVLNSGEGDYAAALETFEQALALRQQIVDTRGTAESLFHVGLIAERRAEAEATRERYETVRARYEEARETATTHGHQLEESYALRHLAGFALEVGDTAAAREGFDRSLALREQLGYTILVPLAQIAFGDALLASGDAEGAEHQYRQAGDLAATIEVPLARVFAHLSLGTLYQQRGDTTQARERFEQALAEARAIGLRLGIQAASSALEALPTQSKP